MIYSRANFLTKEDLREFPILDDDGCLMKFFKQICADMGMKEKTLSLPYFVDLQYPPRLDPTKYGALIVLDTYYCFNSAWTLEIIRNNMMSRPEYAPMLEKVNALLEKYRKFVATYVTDWHLSDDASASELFNEAVNARILNSVVVPTENVKAYTEYERRAAETEEPIYGLITLFTCYAFWPILFRTFGTDIPDDDLYKDWITGNQGGHSAMAVDGIVQTYWLDAGHELDKDKVQTIIENCLMCEYKMFKEG